MKIAIIGSGIAGLFSGLIIKKSIKDAQITIFEKNDEIGGRIKTVNFEGQEVIAGAGIGRRVDKLLYALCKNLNVTTNEYHAEFEHTSEPIDITKVLSFLKENVCYLLRDKDNFKEFATKILGKEIYSKFIFSTGETDYEKADVIDTIFDYGFENYTSSGFDAFSIKWNELLKSFEILLKDDIKLNKNIKKISEWQKLHPDFSDPESKQNDKYMQIVLNSMSGSTKEESDKNYEKIAKNVIKEVVIEK